MSKNRTSSASSRASEASGAQIGQPSQSIGRTLTLLMAVACGTCAANIYYNQPLLALLERSFAGQNAVIDWVPTVTQLGFAVGLVCLVPLGVCRTLHTSGR